MSTYKIIKRKDVVRAEAEGVALVGPGCEIHETVMFDECSEENRVMIGKNVSIGANVEIQAGVVILAGSHISSGTVLQKNCSVGAFTFVGHNVVMRPETHIGSQCVIGHGTVFEGVTKVKNNTLIHAQCHITKGVEIGEGVFIAPLFVGANDPKMAHMRRSVVPGYFDPFKIEDYVRIAVGVTILPGVTLGRNSVIGAHALVTKSVQENAVVIGAPAKWAAWVPEEERL